LNYLHKLKSKIWLQLFVIYTRYLIGAAFVFASVVKIQGKRFTTIDGINEPINSAWHMFETLYQSGLWWKVMGLGQLIAGLLLMTQRYAKLGALMFLPIVANVFVITLSYDFRGTPLITGLMLIANIMLVLWDWDELKVLVNKTPLMFQPNRFENMRIWEITGLALFLFTAIYRAGVTGYNIILWVIVCLAIGIIGLIIGLYKYRKTLNAKI
jgi:VanZ family protein